MNAAAGDAPMVFAVVDADAVAAVVGDWTGIPIGRMVKNEIASVLAIADKLKERVVGQDHAMDAIAKRIKTSRAKLDNPNKPVGVFMLCGPSGVGKTETAHVLSELLYSGDDSMIIINMSEFQEAPHGLDPEGRAGRLCRLRPGWCPDRGRAAPALQRRPAGRGRKGPPGCPRDVLPGVRQGLHERFRRPPYRLQEHLDPADLQCRYRS